MKYFVRLLVIFFLFVSICRSDAQSNLTKWAMEDVLLKKPVTCRDSEITVGEAIQEFSKQTGVNLLIDPKLNESGEIVMINIQNVPLANALESLSALFSLPHAEWKWGRIESNHKFRYKLYPSKLSDVEALMTREARRAFLEYIGALRKYLALSEEDQEKQKAIYSKAMLQKDDKLADTYLSLRKDGFLSRIKAVLELMDDNKIASALSGERLKVALADLTESQRTAVMQFYAKYKFSLSHNGIPDPLSPEPTYVSIYASNNSGNMPTIMLSVEHSLGLSCLGPGVSGGFLHALARAWMMQGDEVTSPTEDQVIPKFAYNLLSKQKIFSRSGRRIPDFTPGESYEAILDKIASACNIPIIVKMDRDSRVRGQELKPKTKLSEFLESTEYGISKVKMHKWRKGVLLISKPDWFLDQDKAVPLEIIDKVQTSLAKQDGKGTLQEIVKQFSSLASSQWRSVVDRFPALHIFDEREGLLQFTANHTELLYPSGMGIEQENRSELIKILPLVNSSFFEEHAKMRWRTITTRLKDRFAPVFKLEFQDQRGRWSELADTKGMFILNYNEP